MIPLDFPHSVSVSRQQRSVEDLGVSFEGLTQVYASVPALIEPMAAWRQATILGDVAGMRLHFTWGPEVLRDGDIVTWNGTHFRFTQHVRDQFRDPQSTTIPAYQTGYLEEEILSPD